MMKRKTKEVLAMFLAVITLFGCFTTDLFLLSVQADEADNDECLKLLSYCAPDEFTVWDDSLGFLSDEQSSELEKYINSNIVAKDDKEYVKAQKIFEWIYTNVNYDYDLTGAQLNPYDVFTYKLAVCGGYSNLYKAMLNAIGIPSVVVAGTIPPSVIGNPYGAAHAWNAVYADGRWFYSDATWGGDYFDRGSYSFLLDHVPTKLSGVSVKTQDGLLIGYDNGISVVGTTNAETSIKVPDMYKDLYVTSVSYKLFDPQYDIKSLELGAYIKKIDTQAAMGSDTLESVAVSDKNDTYATRDGVLFTKDFSEILLYPAEKNSDTFVLPKGTTTFDTKDSFSNRYLKNIEVEAGNTKYVSYDGALYNADKTRLVIIPAGKTSIHVLPEAAVDMMTFANVKDLQNLVIYGKKGSPAHQFAETYYLTFIEETEEPEKPKPTVTEVPKPTVTEVPKPTVTEAPKPTVTEAPKPTVTEAPKPTVTEVPKPTKPSEKDNPFVDVSKMDFYYAPVLWASENKYTTGVSETKFAPGDGCTREQIITFIWRSLGEPKSGNRTCSFTDINKDHYYYDAMLWGVSEGIIKGYDDITFGVGDVCTRGQIVTMLWRAAGSPNAKNNHNPFADVSADHYCYNAMLWAVEQHITNGVTATTFVPDQPVTRGETVTFLYRAN